MSEKIEIEGAAGSGAGTMFSGRKELGEADNTKKVGVVLSDIVKGLSIVKTAEKTKGENFKRLIITSQTTKKAEEGCVKPFSDKIKTLIAKIKS